MSGALWAGIEAGGTKFVCGVGRSPTEILRTYVAPTRSPVETLAEVAAFFAEAQAEFGPIAALGVASFGPLDLDSQSPRFGHLAATPKSGWGGFDLRGALQRAFDCPVAIDTDVAGAGLAEAALGAGRGLGSLAYVTIGTGVGGALIVDGRPAHHGRHPEMGHIPVRRHPEDADFAGTCPFHGDCLEGLASGPAVLARSGRKLSDLPADAPIWAILADYLAQLCLSITLISAPQRMVLGGGVMSNPQLYRLIRRRFFEINSSYIAWLRTPEALDAFIVPPTLGDRAGLIGATLLAQGLCQANIG